MPTSIPRMKPLTIVMIMGPLFLVSCAGRFDRPRIPAVIVIPAPDGKTGNYTLMDYQTDLSAYTAASGDSARALRNKIAYGVMAEIDYAFYDYETKLFLNQGLFSVGSDFLQLGLASAGTITNGARAKTVLSAVLSGVTGVNLSIDKNFFRQQTVQAIASSMEANRDRTKSVILQQLAQDTIAYPFQAARADLIKYFFAGTLSAGLQQIHQDSAIAAQQQRSDLNRIQVSGITPEDLKAATDLNVAIAGAFQSGDFGKVITTLKAMGVSIDSSASRDGVEAAVRDMGRKTSTDPALRRKYVDAARSAGLIP
jgi:hypothetical protein